MKVLAIALALIVLAGPAFAVECALIDDGADDTAGTADDSLVRFYTGPECVEDFPLRGWRSVTVSRPAAPTYDTATETRTQAISITADEYIFGWSVQPKTGTEIDAENVLSGSTLNDAATARDLEKDKQEIVGSVDAVTDAETKTALEQLLEWLGIK